MNPKLRVDFVVPAAGCGSRANLGSNKILASLRGRTVLEWTLRALLRPEAMPENCVCAGVVVVARREEWPLIQEVFRAFPEPWHERMRVAEGGATRQDSVESGALQSQGDIIAVHDAARPLIEPQVIASVLREAARHGAAMAALPASDTIKVALNSGIADAQVEQTLDRARVWLAQTPQAFGRDLLLQALRVARASGFQGTDCASLFEHWREAEGEAVPRVRLVEGSAHNFKITFAHDLARAERELQVLGEG